MKKFIAFKARELKADGDSGVVTGRASTYDTLHVRHSIATGILHGAVLLTAVGAVLGLDAGRVVRGLPIGALSGVGGALIYYLLVALVDRRTYGSAIPRPGSGCGSSLPCSMAVGCVHHSVGRGGRL